MDSWIFIFWVIIYNPTLVYFLLKLFQLWLLEATRAFFFASLCLECSFTSFQDSAEMKNIPKSPILILIAHHSRLYIFPVHLKFMSTMVLTYLYLLSFPLDNKLFEGSDYVLFISYA